MVTIRAFQAIRPNAQDVAKIASLPYDVLSSDEARELVAENEKSFLVVDKAEVNLDKHIDVHSEHVYSEAAIQLQNFLNRGWLIKEDKPALYLYELTMNGRSQLGLVATTSVAEYEQGKIKKHEFTRPEKELDRINHSDFCDANTSPIFLTYKGVEEIETLKQNWAKTNEPIYDFTSFYHVTHRVWKIDDSAVIEKLQKAYATSVDALYIADGHHRTESAVKVGLKRKEEFPDADESAAFNFFLSVTFPKEALEILDYNRAVKTPLPENFFEKLEEMFTIAPASSLETAKPTKRHEFALYTNEGWFKLVAKETIQSHDEVNGLDVAILQDNVLAPLLGIDDPRSSQNIDFIGGIRGLSELEKLVQSNAYSCAFALFPPSMDELLRVADAGKTMPPKSTWFEPKLLSGLFLHEFD